MDFTGFPCGNGGRQVIAVAAFILSIGALALAPGVSPASADAFSPQALGLRPIEPATNKEAVVPYSTAKERLDPSAVQGYISAFHVSEEVATERLAIQTMVPNLVAQLEEAAGNDFGALWFDNGVGQWVIDVRAGGVGPAERLMSDVGLADHYRLVTVPWNAYQLDSLRSGLAVKLGSASVGVAGDHISVDLPGAPTSAEKDTIASSRYVFAAAEGIAEAPAVETTESAEIAVPAHGSVSCGKYGIEDTGTGGFCNTLAAGDRWSTTAGSCTMAWWVSIKEREPKEFPSILTAGHCIASVGDVAPAYTCEPEATSCNQFGLTLTYYQGEGRGDAGLIDYYSGLYGSPTFPLASGYWNWWDSELSPLEYYELTPPSNGTAICLQGFRTGSSCGEVLRSGVTEQTTEGATDSNLIEVKLTSGSDCKGDSGGPWDLAARDTAVGINDLTNGNEHNKECGNIAWLTPVEEPVSDWGLIVWGDGAWHEPW